MFGGIGAFTDAQRGRLRNSTRSSELLNDPSIGTLMGIGPPRIKKSSVEPVHKISWTDPFNLEDIPAFEALRKDLDELND